MSCYYCAWGRSHSLHCPESKTRAEKDKAIADFRDGYQHGRRGDEAARGTGTPVFNLGFQRGTVALEEYDNGYQVWGRAE